LTGLASADQRQAPAAFALAGTRAAVWIDGTLRVLDEEADSFVEVQAPARAVALEFWNQDTVILFAARGGDGVPPYVELLHLHVSQARLVSVERYDHVADLGALHTVALGPSFDPSPRTDRFVLRHQDRKGLGIYRKDDGTQIGWMGVDADPSTGVLLATIWTAALVDSGNETVVHFLHPEGNPMNAVSIGPCEQGRIAISSRRPPVHVGCRDRSVRLSPDGMVQASPTPFLPLPYRRVPGAAVLPQAMASMVLFDPGRGLVTHYPPGGPVEYEPLLAVAGLRNQSPAARQQPPESPTP
jgi:hypothetical protein